MYRYGLQLESLFIVQLRCRDAKSNKNKNKVIPIKKGRCCKENDDHLFRREYHVRFLLLLKP